MQIGLNIAGQALPFTATGLTLPQMVMTPAITGDGREGTMLVADTSDSWTYDGSPASVIQRQYRLTIDGAGAVPPGANASVEVPLGTVGGLYSMQLRVQVTQAEDIWSPWQTIASGNITGRPQLSAANAIATSETDYSGTVSTDTGNGTLYWMVSATPQPPTINALKAAESQPITTTGTQSVSGNSLAASTEYHVHFVQQDATGLDSTIVSSGAFTTNAPPVGEPAAFGAGDWSITDLGTGGDARLTITGLPDDGGAALKAIFYSIDGGAWVPLPLLGPGSADLIDLFTDGTASALRLLAENLIGPGPQSAPKLITTTLSAPATWTITDTGDGRFTLSDAPPAVAAPDITNNGDGTFAVLA